MGVLFKTSVFGGFRKQEVIEYIEKLKSNSAEDVKQLEGERDAARRLEQQADEKAVLTEDRLAALQQELLDQQGQFRRKRFQDRIILLHGRA